MPDVLTPTIGDAIEPWMAGTPIEGTTTAGPIVDALSRQARMLAPRTTERFVFLGGPINAPASSGQDLALLSVLPLASLTAPAPFAGPAFARVQSLASIALEPLAAATAAYMPLLRIPHHGGHRVAPAPQSRAFRAFTELAGWLGTTQEETAALLSIGRTTPLAWRRGHEPQPARARRLFQTHALVKTLVRRLGTDEARRWLGRGTPTPLDLIAAGDVAAADDRAEALIFGEVVHSRLDQWVDDDVTAAPSPPPTASAGGTPRRVRRRAPRRR